MSPGVGIVHRGDRHRRRRRLTLEQRARLDARACTRHRYGPVPLAQRSERRGTARRGRPGRRGRPTSPRPADEGDARRRAGGPASAATVAGRRRSPSAGRTVGGTGTAPSTSRDDRRAVDVVQPQLGAHRDAVGQGGDGDRLDVLGDHEVAPVDERRGRAPSAAGPASRAATHRPAPGGGAGSRRPARRSSDRPRLDGDRLARPLQGDQAAGVGDRLDRSAPPAGGRCAGRGRPTPRRPSGSRTPRAAGSGRAGPRAAGRCPRTRPGWRWRGRGTARRSGNVVPSTVTCRSCIASSSAACVFGGVRLISSASSRPVKTGPGAEDELGRALIEHERRR